MKFYQLVKKNYNRSTNIIINNMIGNLLEILHSIVLIRGNNYLSLPKYLEVSKYQYGFLEEAHLELLIQSYIIPICYSWKIMRRPVYQSIKISRYSMKH